MAKNSNLTRAKNAKNDEFYTQSADIENELKYYRPHFKDKIVYLNCDDPTTSNFWRYFYRSFEFLGLKKLISTHYNMDGSSSYALIYEGGHDNADNFDEGVVKVPLKGNGDFRSDECVEYLKQSDIVVTNPMFSLFREYVALLMKYHKQFLIWGNQNAITYKEFFPLLMNRQVWIGNLANKTCVFRIPDDYKKWDKKETEKRNDGHHYAKVPAITTFTNMSLNKSTDQTVLWKKFNQDDYPAYDNYAAFEVSKVADIPVDTEIEAEIDSDNLDGWKKTYGDDLVVLDNDGKVAKVKISNPIWATPITVLDKYNPQSTVKQHNLAEEFDVLGYSSKNMGFVSCFKFYKDMQQSQKDGTYRRNSKSARFSPMVGYSKRPTKTHYIASNTSKYICKKYGRVFIRRKKERAKTINENNN